MTKIKYLAYIEICHKKGVIIYAGPENREIRNICLMYGYYDSKLKLTDTGMLKFKEWLESSIKK